MLFPRSIVGIHTFFISHILPSRSLRRLRTLTVAQTTPTSITLTGTVNAAQSPRLINSKNIRDFDRLYVHRLLPGPLF